MRVFVEDLKRLYNKEKITKKKVKSYLDKGTITQGEYDYIVGV